jgi:D-alanyl-D-alanine carboxypeptidase
VRAPAPGVPAADIKLGPIDTARADCRAQGWTAAAEMNSGSLRTLAWAPFGRDEVGWEIYVPLIQHEIGTTCPPASEAFAAALSRWAKAHDLPAEGTLNETLFSELKGAVQGRRDFVRLTAGGFCPDGSNDVVQVGYAEGYGGKPILIRPAAMAAYRKMVAAAKAEDPEIAKDPNNLTIFSGYRSPAADAQRCAEEGNCNGIVRARCSAHRTGLALDLYVGHAPDYPPDSSADPNRLFMTNTPTYRWLVANAGRFGFANYPFEPWHWEWTGEAP